MQPYLTNLHVHVGTKQQRGGRTFELDNSRPSIRQPSTRVHTTNPPIPNLQPNLWRWPSNTNKATMPPPKQLSRCPLCRTHPHHCPTRTNNNHGSTRRHATTKRNRPHARNPNGRRNAHDNPNAMTQPTVNIGHVGATTSDHQMWWASPSPTIGHARWRNQLDIPNPRAQPISGHTGATTCCLGSTPKILRTKFDLLDTLARQRPSPVHTGASPAVPCRARWRNPSLETKTRAWPHTLAQPMSTSGRVGAPNLPAQTNVAQTGSISHAHWHNQIGPPKHVVGVNVYMSNTVCNHIWRR